MRSRLFFFLALMSFATAGFSKDVYLSIAGTVNNFHTDARIFNPSTTKDITIQAYFLPYKGDGSDNSNAQPVPLTIPKRSQKVFDDAVTAIFGANGIGAIRLSSADDFVATSRIFAVVSNNCYTNGTLGQFVQGLDSSAALKNGVLIQGKSTGSVYRTNLGAANPNAATANITWRLYDKNNALIGEPKTSTLSPFNGFQQNVAAFFGTSVDLSDAWVSFTSDQPLFGFFSVLDNATTDPTFITASADSGAGSGSNTTAKVFSVTTRSFAIDITPPPNGLAVGDVVELHIVGRDTTHGFEILAPDGTLSVPDTAIEPNKAEIVRTFTVTKQGTYLYTCTNATCGTGHGDMAGTFMVGAGDDSPPKPGY